MRSLFCLLVCAFFLVIVGCGEASPACPTSISRPIYLTIPPGQLATPTPGVGRLSVLVGNQEFQVDKVVTGALCNDTWSGSVYVSCDVQVYPWQEQPDFLKDCQLTIEPNTVVYVAYHNNSAYYNGCSCHTGATPEP